MQGKRFKARSIQKALAAIKDELGPDAMILSTRRVPKSPRDPYAEDLFEVEAAPKAPDGSDRGRGGGATFDPLPDLPAGRGKQADENGGGGAVKRAGDLFHRAAGMDGSSEKRRGPKANGASISSTVGSTEIGSEKGRDPAVEGGGGERDPV